MRTAIVVAAIAALGFALAAGTSGQASVASFTKRALVGDHFFLGFLAKTADLTSVEATGDLSTWILIASVATTNGIRFMESRQDG